MGLFSDITSAIGSVFGNSSQPASDPNDLKKKQNIPNAPTINNNLTASKINLPKPLVNTPGPPKPVIPITAPTAANTDNLTATPQQDLFHSLLGHVTNIVNNNVVQPVKQQVQGVENAVSDIPVIGKPLVSADKGIALGGARAGEGAVTGTVSTPSAILHGTNAVANDITGNTGVPGWVGGVDRVTNDINAPINKVAVATDTAAHNSGQLGNDLYKPAQIAANVATVVPLAAEAATRLPVVGDRIATQLSKIPGISVGNAVKEAGGEATTVGGDEVAPTVTDNTPPETGTKGPEEPTPTNAPTNEPGKPAAQPGATESGVKPNPDVPATTPVEPKIPVTTEPTPIIPPEAAPVQTPPVEQTPQAPAEAPAPEVAAPPKAPAVAPGQAASEAVAASPEQQAVVDEAPNVTFKKTENPLKGEEPPANPYGINPIEGLDDATAAEGGTKAQLNEGDKLLSPRAQLSKVGAAGRQLLQLFRNKEFNEGRLTTAMENDTPTFHDLSPKDQATAAKVVRGEVTTDNPKINQAAQELQNHFKNVLQAARAAGIDVGDLGEKYIPQMKEAGYFDKASNIKKLIKTLVGKGYSEEDATQTVNKLRNDVRSRPNLAGHLELPREVEDPDQNFNSTKLRAYNEQVASRIAEAQHYGANNEEITKLHGKAAQNGEDVNQIRQITEDYMHPKAVSRGATSKIATGVRGVTNVALLPKAALSHTFQGLANTASDVGFGKYFKALAGKTFSSDERDFINESGIKNIGKEERSVLDKATAPGLKQLRSFHQQVAVLAGKYHADALAAKGDEAGLRQIGVTGDLEKVPVRGGGERINLTRDQQLQAGKVESDKSIFSDSSLETSKALKGNVGKAIGQFRTAYVAKQGGRIIDLVKQARNGDVAPLLRYLAVGVPVAGTGTLALKNLYKTGNPNPFPSGTSVNSDVLNVAQNSGIETPGFGLPESAVNAVRYNYNNNDRVNNAAGAVSPIAGIATEAGQNIDQALRGDKAPLIKQGASYIPLPVVGSKIDQKYAPTKPITPDEQKFFNAYGPALQKLNNTVNPFNKSATNQNTRVTDDIKSLTSNDHNAQGQSIQKSPAETQAQWTTIAGLPTSAQNAYQTFQKSLPNHSPAYDLTGNGTVIDKNGNQSTASKFQVYANYEKELPGSAERSQLESLNPWLTKTFQAEQAQFNSSVSKGTSVPYNGPLPGGLTLKDLQYPTVPPAINDLMNQATALSSIPAANRTPEQIAQLQNIENNPDLQSAYTALDNYTNNQRVARGAPPLKLAPNASPAVQAAINAYDALPASKSGGNTDSATSGERSAWIKANPALYAQMQNYYASVDLANVSKGGAENELEGNSPSQSFLSAIKGEGADVLSTKNANGTTSYSINPAAADAAAYGSGSGSTSASATAYDRDKAAGLSDLGTKYSTKAKVTGLKADTKKYTPPKLLADTAPTGKNGNPFIQAITTTKGVKQRKGGDNIYAANISNSKGVKTA